VTVKRVIRTLLIVGPVDWVDRTLANSLVGPDRVFQAGPGGPGGTWRIEEMSRSVEMLDGGADGVKKAGGVEGVEDVV
jgi:hypothetical protein